MTYLDSLDLKLKGGILVGDDHGVRVELETGQRPHVVDALLNASLQSKGLALAENDDNDLACLKNGLDANSESHLGHFVNIAVEETRVGKDGVVGKCLDTSAAGKTGARLVEGNVAILTNASKEEVYSASGLDGVFVANALGLEVGGVAIEDVDVGGVDVDVGEEVLPHEGVVRLGVIAGDAHVLVHVERDDIFKADLYGIRITCMQMVFGASAHLAGLVLLDKNLVDA